MKTMLKMFVNVLDFFMNFDIIMSRGDSMDKILDAFVNNGAAIGLLLYFVFRDYKHDEKMLLSINTLQLTVQAMKDSVDELIRVSRSKLKEGEQNE